MPRISVVVPVYDVEKYLKQCVDSILSQTFTDFELILVDDGSPDKCGLICEEYKKKDNRIHVIHKENGGLSDARNAGISWIFANSDSEWITFIDSDDWVHPHYLEILLNGAIKYNTDISACSFCLTSDRNREFGELSGSVNCKSPEDVYTNNGKAIEAFAWAKLYKRSCFADVRYPKGKLWEDLYTTHKVLFKTNYIAKTDEQLYYYYINSEGITHKKWTPKNLDFIVACEELIKYFKNNKFVAKFVEAMYIDGLYDQYVKCGESNITEKEQKKYKKKFKRKLQRALIIYRRDKDITKPKPWYYDTAFPHIMWLYTGIKERIKK